MSQSYRHTCPVDMCKSMTGKANAHSASLASSLADICLLYHEILSIDLSGLVLKRKGSGPKLQRLPARALFLSFDSYGLRGVTLVSARTSSKLSMCWTRRTK